MPLPPGLQAALSNVSFFFKSLIIKPPAFSALIQLPPPFLELSGVSFLRPVVNYLTRKVPLVLSATVRHTRPGSFLQVHFKHFPRGALEWYRFLLFVPRGCFFCPPVGSAVAPNWSRPSLALHGTLPSPFFFVFFFLFFFAAPTLVFSACRCYSMHLLRVPFPGDPRLFSATPHPILLLPTPPFHNPPPRHLAFPLILHGSIFLLFSLGFTIAS